MATKYVTTTGSDSNTGDTPSTAYRTISYALAHIAGGDLVQVHEGTYAEHLTNNIPGGTAWDHCTRIWAAPGEKVWLKPPDYAKYWSIYLSQSGQQFIELKGINIDSRKTRGGVRIESWASGNPHHIRFRDAEIIGGPDGVSETLYGPQHFNITQSVSGLQGGHEFINLKVHGGGDPGEMYYGFYINADNTLVHGCEIYDVSGYCIQVYSGYSSHQDVKNVTIRNCTIHDITRSMDQRAGCPMASGTGHTFANNVLWNIKLGDSFGVSVYPGVTCDVYNNTFYALRCGVRAQAGSKPVVKNNIAYRCTHNVLNENGSASIASNNLFSGVDPLFVDEAKYDLRLRSTDSPAFETGVELSEVPTDSTGEPRSDPPDMGAFELTAPITTDPPPPTSCEGTSALILVVKPCCLKEAIQQLIDSGILGRTRPR